MEENVFEQMAKRYDTAEREQLASIVVEEVKPEIQNSRSKTLIDYGSGTGLVGLALSDLVESILLVDSSQQMLDVAQAKITHSDITNAKVLYTDFTKESPELQADIVLVSLVLLHVPDTKKILQELYNALTDGGKLIIVDFDKNDKVTHPKVHNGFVHKELMQLLSEVGFIDVDIRNFYSGKNIFVNEDATMFISTGVK